VLEAAMKLATASRNETGSPWAIGSRNPLRIGYRIPGWINSRWQGMTAERGLPGGLRDRLALVRGERILTVGRDPSASPALVATERALYHRGDEAGDEWWRQGWERVSAVDWDALGRRLVFTGFTDTGLATQRHLIPLQDLGRLLELADERITHTRLGRWPLPLPAGEPVTVEARRKPVSGELMWLIHMDGVSWDVRDDAHAYITSAITRLADSLGIPRQAGPAEGPAEITSLRKSPRP
jgi:hypothetical protein